jgi:DNA-binding transcriptional LysR family regulator
MDPRRLRYFVAVAEERSVGRAAVRPRMAQPPLSVQIRKLEAEVGTPLFRRGTRGMELTEAGRALLSCAREALAGSSTIGVKVLASIGLVCLPYARRQIATRYQRITTSSAARAPAIPDRISRRRRCCRSSRQGSGRASAGFRYRRACRDSRDRSARWRARIGSKPPPPS